MSLVLRMLNQLERDGYTFTLREDGRFIVRPIPAEGTPVHKFCARNREHIALELWCRSLCAPPATPDGLAARARELFGEPAGAWERSCGDVLDSLSELWETELAHLPLPERQEEALRVLSRLIGTLGAQGRTVEQGWAVRAFLDLGNLANQTQADPLKRSA